MRQYKENQRSERLSGNTALVSSSERRKSINEDEDLASAGWFDDPDFQSREQADDQKFIEIMLTERSLDN